MAMMVYLTVADIPYVEPGEGCVDGISAYQVGETFNKECQTCTCKKDGTFNCSVCILSSVKSHEFMQSY